MERADPAYIDKNIRNGQFVEVSSPRPKPLERPERLLTRQKQIAHQARISCDLVSDPDVIVVPVVDTDEQLMIVHIQPQQIPLRSEPPPSDHQRKKSSAKSARDKAAFYLDVATQLKNGTIRSHDDLVRVCGDEDKAVATLKSIGKLKSGSTSLQTVEGVVELHVEKILQRSLPDGREVVCRVRFQGFQIEKGETVAHLRVNKEVIQPLTRVSSAPVRKVLLDTSNKMRMLKMFQGLAFLDEEAEVVMGRSFELWTQKWQLTVKRFADEAVVKTALKSLSDLLPD